MKVPLRVGAFRAPHFEFLKSPSRLKIDAARKAAAITGAVVLVAGAGIGSALFVDYLAERAVARAAAAPRSEVASPAPIQAASKTSKLAAEPKPVAALPATAPAGNQVEQLAWTANAPVERPAATAAKEPAPEIPTSLTALAEDTSTDRTFTAAIPQRPEETAFAAANNEIDEAAVEAGGDEQSVEDGVGEQAAVAAAEVTKGAEPVEPTRTAKVTKYVNLRAGPKDEAKVLTVIPASGTVQVVSCDGWCEVEFKGQRGWIYKSFIDG